ncbi:MAG: hypothetical protein KatS3mg008_0833 [Acidimicrobiales bacterium]|nr:MAG: hypothetical protein KatS3mg008_0833 [Acidimicrobiales bacterium]
MVWSEARFCVGSLIELPEGSLVVSRGACRLLVSAAVLLSVGGLLPAEPGGAVHDTPGATELVSVDASGGPANSESVNPSVSGDGRFVAFASLASDLVPGDTNGVSDVFVRDVVSGVTQLISVDQFGGPANEGSYSPHLSSDGRFVAFYSFASDLVPGDTNFAADVFVRDLVSGVTRLVTVNQSGDPANNSSYSPSVSADGRFVAFESFASDLVPGDTNGVRDIYVRDLESGLTQLVSANGSGGPANNHSFSPSVSADGRFVVFLSHASDVVPGDSNALPDIFIRDLMSGVTQLVSVDRFGGPANGESYSPAVVSADGRKVAFSSSASDLVMDDYNGYSDVFVRDVISGVTSLVSVDQFGGAANGDSGLASISADGRFVGFGSLASDLVPADNNMTNDVFVRDMVSGVTQLVSVDAEGGPSDGFSSRPQISADGRLVAFYSDASDLVRSDTNGGRDVFVRHLECVSRFVDVSSSSVFCDAIAAMSGAGVVRGFSDGTFRPLLTANRQELAAMLYRWSGSPGFTPPATPTFSDVPSSHTFFREIEWAASSGVVRGFSDGTFRPVRVVTRQELVAMLYRLFRSWGHPPHTPPSMASFSDVPTSHPFFTEIEWAAKFGVANGFSDGTFRPTASLRRQELAAFLTRARWVV